MNWLDIVIIIILFLGIWDGYRKGVVVQLMGLVALFAGIYFAFRFGPGLGRFFGMEGVTANVVGFAVMFVGVIILLVIIGRATRGLFRLVGLGIFDRLLGAIFSLFKVCLLTGLVLMLLKVADPQGKLIKPCVTQSSVMYARVIKVTEASFPYLNMLTGTLWDALQGMGECPKTGKI